MKLINTHARNNNIDSMKTEDRGVSVLVAAYNAETTIRRCLDSLLQQTFFDMKLSLRQFRIVSLSLLNVRTVADFCMKLGSSVIKLFLCRRVQIR